MTISRFRHESARFWLAGLMALALGGVASLPVQAQAGPPVDPARAVHDVVLDNGLRVLVYPRGDEPPIASVQVWVGAGGADDPEGKEGLAHFFEHMIFQGSENLGPREFSRRIEAVGGRSNAGTAQDFTYYYVSLPSEHVGEGIALLGEALSRPTFPQAELERERQVIFREIEFRHDDPTRFTLYLLNGLLHEGHPYARPVLGTRESVASITREDMWDFYRRYYVPNNMVLTIVGDVDAAAAIAAAEASFGSMEPKPVPSRANPEPRPLGRVLAAGQARDWEQGRLMLGWYAPAASDDDAYALEMLRSLLSRGRSSRFQRHIQREQRLVTSISASYLDSRDRGTFIVYTQQPAGQEGQVEAAVLAELDRIRRGSVSEGELERARRMLLADATIGLQSHQAMASSLGYAQLIEGDWRRVFQLGEKVRAVAVEDVVRVARAYLSPEGYVRVYAGPEAPPGPGGVAAEPAAGAPTLAGQPVRYVLDNGHVLILQDMPHAPVIAVETAVRAGLLDEPEGKAGLAGLTLRMLLKGTETLPEEEFLTRVEELGGRIGGRSLPDTAHLSLVALPEAFEDLLPLYAEALQAPGLPEDIFERERQQLARELRGNFDQYLQVALEAFQQARYGDHPYGKTTAVRLEELAHITIDDVADFHRQQFTPGNMVTAVVGPIDIPAVKAALEKVFGGRPARGGAGGSPRKGPVVSGGDQAVHRDTEAGWLVLGFPAPAMAGEDLAAADLLRTVVGGGSTSLLMEELRERLGITYTTGAVFPHRRDAGYFAVYAVVPPSQEAIDKATEGIYRTLEYVATRLQDEEVERARQLLLGQSIMERETVEGQAAALARFEALGYGYHMVQRYPELLRGITKDALQQMAARLLVREGAIRAYVVPAPEDPAF